jgi:hypothetical protein
VYDTHPDGATPIETSPALRAPGAPRELPGLLAPSRLRFDGDDDHARVVEQNERAAEQHRDAEDRSRRDRTHDGG